MIWLIDHDISVLSADFRFTEKIRASKPEDDVCLRPVLAERSAQRSRQEQEVLLSQSQTHVGGGRGSVVGTGAGLMSWTSKPTLSLSQVGQRHQGGARKLPREEKVDNSQTAPDQKTHPVSV